MAGDQVGTTSGAEEWETIGHIGVDSATLLIGDPLFRDMAAGDFRLRPGSPAIAAGARTPYDRDFDGRPIPAAGKAPDIGAFEFVAD